MHRKISKYLSLLLTLAMTLSLFVAPASAASGYSDTSGHWAEGSIERWSGYNIVSGADGAFMPDASMTRGQFAKVLSNLLGLTETPAANPFTDVPADAWYAPFMLRCYAAGILLGADGKGNPEAPVSRQEAMTMIARALDIAPADASVIASYNDAGSVADWAAGCVAALVSSGIVGGVGDNLLAPASEINRASVMTVFDRAIVQYINAPGAYTLTDKDGIVLIAAGDVTLTGTTRANLLVSPAADGKAVKFDKASVTGRIVVQADDAKLTASADSSLPTPTMNGAGSTFAKADEQQKPTTKPGSGSGGGSSSGGGGGSSGGGGGSNTPTVVAETTISSAGTTITGEANKTYTNVTVTDAVGNGTVTLKNMTITGTLTVKGGGDESIKLENCSLTGKIVLDKQTTDESDKLPRLELTGTPVPVIEAAKPAIIEAKDAVSAVKNMQVSADVEVRGEATKIEKATVPAEAGTVEAPVEIKVTGGTLDAVEANSDTTLIADGGEVKTVTAKDMLTVAGTNGKVGEVQAESHVVVAAEIVEKVEIPATVTQAVTVDVTGTTGSVEIDNRSDEALVAVAAEDGVTVTKAEESKEITEHKHSFDEGVPTPATCTEAGKTVYTCSAEGCPLPNHERVETIPALGHDWGEWTHPDNEHHVRVCKKDETHKVEGECKWNDGVVTTPASCKAEGVKTFTCSICGGTKTEQIAKAEHTWNDGVVTTPATATEDGVKTFTCTVCGETKTEKIPATGGGAGGETTTATLGKPELKTDGSKVWVEAAASGLSDSDEVEVWLSPVPSAVMIIGKNSKYFSFSDGVLKVYLDPLLSTGNKAISNASAALAVHGLEGSKTAFSGKKLVMGTVTTSDDVLSAEKSTDGKTLTVTNTSGAFATTGTYGCTLTQSGSSSTSNLYLSSSSADALVFTDFTNLLPTADTATVRRAVPTDGTDAITVSYETYSVSLSGGTEQPGETSFAISASTGSSVVKATWSGFNAPKYALKVLDSDGTEVYRQLVNGTGEVSELFGFLPFAAKSGSYSLALWSTEEKTGSDGSSTWTYYPDGQQLAVLKNAIQIAVAGDALDYTITYNKAADGTAQAGQHQIAVNGNPAGVVCLNRWIKADGPNSSRGWSSVGSKLTQLTQNHQLTNGDQFDLRLVTASQLVNGVWSVTMTPAALTTYTEGSSSSSSGSSGETDTVKQITLKATANSFQIFFPKAEGNSEYYLSVNNAQAQKITPFGADSLGWNVNNTILAAKPGDALSFTIRLGSADGEVWAKAKDLVTFVQGSETTNVSVVGQEDGTYKFVPAQAGNKGYDFTMRTPNGRNIYSWRTTGTFDVAPYKGCTFDVTEYSWAETGDALTALTVTVAEQATGVAFTPYDFSELSKEVTDEDTFKAAINRGGKVTLANDVTVTNCRIDRGGDVTLDLNGHTLTIGSSNELGVSNGKRLTIDGSTLGSKIVGTAGLNVYGASTLECVGITADRICATARDEEAPATLTLEKATAAMLQFQNAKVTIIGGEYGAGIENFGKGVSAQRSSKVDISHATISGILDAWGTSTITLTDCDISNLGEGTIRAYNDAKITLDQDPGNKVQTTCDTFKSDNGTWTVTAPQPN